MDITKLTSKEAAKLGFLLGLASPALLFNPISFSSNQNIICAENTESAIHRDELNVLKDYGYNVGK